MILNDRVGGQTFQNDKIINYFYLFLKSVRRAVVVR